MHQVIEFVFSLGMFINAALFIPQVIKAYREKSADSLSLITFGGFNLIQFSIMLHGYINQDWYLVIGISLSFITCGMVTIQIIYAKFFKRARGRVKN